MSRDMPLDDLIKKLHSRHDLSVDETRTAFDHIFMGHAAPDTLGTFLLALHDKGEVADEIRGAVLSMRSKAVTIAAPDGTIDIVGTGGDGLNTLNISTAVALTVAACGVKVAKHGNRAATSKSGSSDVLAALGINLEPPFPVLGQCLDEANLCFLFAPRHHPSMHHVIDVRRKLGVRTIFNLLGPLTNPANVHYHLIGVYDAKWLLPMAQVLSDLGSQAAWFTHGHDGMDELSICASNDAVALKNGEMNSFVLACNKAGLTPLEDAHALQGGNVEYNAAALLRLFEGEKGPYRDIVLFNAAAALMVANKADDLKHGVVLAAQALDSGAARDTLVKLRFLTNQAVS